MSMTRKDYTLIAETLRARQPNEAWLNKYQMWSYIVNELAEALEANNSNFDRAVFLSKAGVAS